jgi:phage N-6-adenine-methyltransferase
MVIDKEFKALIPALTEDERNGLEASLKTEGCRDALVLWGDILIDGHNRYEICTQYGIPYKTIQKDFDSRDDVIQWIILNQFGRRNLPMYERARLALRLKPVFAEKARERMLSGKANPNQKSDEGMTSKQIAKVAGVSHDTIHKVEKIEAQATDETKEQLRKGNISINQAYKDIKKPHVALNSGNNEWYTPRNIIETARAVMGSVDLDPASSDCANEVVDAETYYTAETDGLTKEWFGNVWMNPPYSTELIDKFVDKLVEQRSNYKQAIVLVNNATETEWFEKIVNIASVVCFPRHRVKFYKPDGKVGAPLQGQAILYIGGASSKFTSLFSEIGWCADVVR